MLQTTYERSKRKKLEREIDWLNRLKPSNTKPKKKRGIYVIKSYKKKLAIHLFVVSMWPIMEDIGYAMIKVLLIS